MSATQESHTIQDVYRLSPVQEGMLLTSLDAPPGAQPYFQQITFALSGRLNSSYLKAAFADLAAKHPVLRAAFAWEGVPHPVQFVRINCPPGWQEEDWRSLSSASQQQRLNDFLDRDRERGFDLRVPPLMRTALFRLADQQHSLTWSLHHSLVDGWSVQRLLNELFTNYRHLTHGEQMTTEPGVPFARYIAWRENANFEQSRDYWSGLLAGLNGPTQLKLGSTIATGGTKEGYFRTELPLGTDASRRIRNALSEARVTLGVAAQASWGSVLGRYSNNNEVVFGVTVSGRPTDLPGSEEIIGPLLNTVPVRVALDNTQPVSEWLLDLSRQQIERLAHETLSPAEINQLANLPPGEELFESILVLVNYPKASAANDLGDLEVGPVHHEEKSHYPLACILVPDDDLRVVLIASDDLVSAQVLDEMAQYFAIQLEAIALNAGRGSDQHGSWQIAQLPAPPHPPGTTTVFEDMPEELAPCLTTILEHCRRSPDAVALQSGEHQVTWSQFERHTQRTAEGLLSLLSECIDRADSDQLLIGVELPRGVEAVLAIVGIQRAGLAYVPLDPDYPDERRAFMRGQAKTAANIVTQEIEQTDANGVSLAALHALAAEQPGKPLPPPCDLAYVLYTSGSTGTPAGVMVSQQNLAYSTAARVAAYPERPESYLLLSSISFDSSVAGIFWTLSAGGTLVVPTQEEIRDPLLLCDLIATHAVTHLLCIPSLYRALLLAAPRQMSSLQVAIVAGEVLPASVVEDHYSALPSCALVNEYGPTEATVWCSLHRCMPDTPYTSVPIGKAIPGTQLLITDDEQREVPRGVIGELCVQGRGVALGYLHQTELTAEKFIQHPARSEAILYRTGDLAYLDSQGDIMFVGRRDTQAKILGKRVDLAEIEKAIQALPGVLDAGAALINTPTTAPSSIAEMAIHLQQLPAHRVEELLTGAELFNADRSKAPPLVIEQPGFRAELQIDSDFIATPRSMQREWLLHQQLQELSEDLQHLHTLSGELVPGKPHEDESFDIADSALSEDRIMEDWQIPLMQAMADDVTHEHGDVLEVGFGRGVSARMIQARGVSSHTIVESNDHSVNAHFEPWRATHPDRDIRLLHARWQDVVEDLGTFDGVFFHTYPMNVEEFIEYVAESATFAEHFFASAASVLRPGGVFVYLTTEIDSLSRRHQRALFKHFSSISMRVLELELPEDVGDAWWSNSMIVLKAYK